MTFGRMFLAIATLGDFQIGFRVPRDSDTFERKYSYGEFRMHQF